MYYNEKWEKGIFYIKTSPLGEWIKKVPSINQLEEAVSDNKISFTQAIAIAIDIHTNKYFIT